MNAVQRWVVVFVALWFLAPAVRAEDKKVQAVKSWGEVTDPDGDCVVKEKDGKLTITVPGKYHDLWVDKGKVNAPRVLQEVEGDFSVQVLVTGVVHPEKGSLIPNIASTVLYQAGGLVIWKDGHTLVRLERGGMVRANGDFGSYAYLQAFAYDARYAEPSKKKVINGGRALDEKDTLLRFERKEGKIFAAASQDGGKNWRNHPDSGFAMDLPAKLKVGVTAIQSTTNEFTAQFEDFKVTAQNGDAPAKKPDIAAAKKPQDEIVGKWTSKSARMDVFMTFTKDGGYDVAVGDKSFKGGTYKFLDDAAVETKMNDQTTRMKISIFDDTLSLT